MTPAEQISSAVLELQQLILKDHPTMPTMLRAIHKQLLADPTTVTLMKEEEIAVIISGLEKYTKTELIAVTKTTSKKPISKMGVLDL